MSRNGTRGVRVLKCDVRKFFASIDHEILLDLLKQQIPDDNIIQLIEKVISSVHSTEIGKGLPLGNLTSQLFANVYLNELDQFIKHRLKQKYYLRYADDFVILSTSRSELEKLIPTISRFLADKLKLTLHPGKVFIKTLASGVDFLGWVHFPDHRVLRTSTKRRMLRRLAGNSSEAVRNSYLGMLGWGNAHKLKKRLAEF